MKLYAALSNTEIQLVFYLILLGCVFFICHECIGMFLSWLSDTYTSLMNNSQIAAP